MSDMLVMVKGQLEMVQVALVMSGQLEMVRVALVMFECMLQQLS